jgi:tetratricopeptide (TPR) repeat protein
VERARAAIEELGAGTRDAEVAAVSVELGTALALAGRYDEAMEPLERGLVAAQALELPLMLCRALNANSLVYLHTGRYDEALGGWELAATLADRHGFTTERARAMSNAGILRIARDIPGAVETLEAAIALGRRSGDKYFEAVATGNLMQSHLFTGRWEELERLGEEAIRSLSEETGDVHGILATLNAWRGEPSGQHLEPLAEWIDSDDMERRFIARTATCAVALSEGRFDDVLESGPAMVKEGLETLGASSETMRHLWPCTFEAALGAGRLDVASELVELLDAQPRGWVAPYLRAELHRAKGLLAAARGEQDGVEDELVAAIDALRELAYPYPLARAELDLAGWLIGRARGADAVPLLDEAVLALTPLRARRLLARAEDLRAEIAPAIA